MAELYLARAVGIAGFERYVVLKRIMAEHARNHRFVTMFLDEARLAAQLHHPNIAQVYDIGRVSDSYFFTMEYVHGENVRDLLQRVAALKRQIPFEVSLTVIAGAAAGLNYAHEKRGMNREPLGIVHRDVSPSNLMVAYEGSVKLVDFGIAKAAHRMTETRSGAVKGKVAYMSPEQCTGHSLDRRSDIFSLGIVLYEMSTMTRLFKHTTDFETMTHIVNHPVPPPSSRRPDLPRELEHIILKALAKKPDDRFQSAGELLDAIEQFSTRERLVLSNMAMARYVRELFGERPEPWYELEVGEQTGLVTVETAAVPEVPEVDPFGPSSTQRSWSGAGKTAPREWAASGSHAAFGENAHPTTPSQRPPDHEPGQRPLMDRAATPTVRGKFDDLAARLEKRNEALVRPPDAAPASGAASMPTLLVAPPGAPFGDAPRKPSTNPAAAPPPPLRMTGQTAAAPGLISGPITPARATLAGLAPPPTASHPPLHSASMAAVAPMTSSAAIAVPAVEEPSLIDGAMHTQLSAPRTAPLLVQHPDLIRDTPDRDPSWAGEHDPSWRGGTGNADAANVRSSRRWVLWSAVATAAAGALILFAIGRGETTASVGNQPPVPPVHQPPVNQPPLQHGGATPSVEPSGPSLVTDPAPLPVVVPADPPPDPIKPDPIKPDPIKLDPIKPDPIKPDPIKPDPIKLAPRAPKQADPARPRTTPANKAAGPKAAATKVKPTGKAATDAKTIRLKPLKKCGDPGGLYPPCE